MEPDEEGQEGVLMLGVFCTSMFSCEYWWTDEENEGTTHFQDASASQEHKLP